MFRWEDCTEAHILLGLALSLMSTLCLTLTTFSTPYIHSIYFLATPDGTRFGAFGHCSEGCTGPRIGWGWPGQMAWAIKGLVLFGLGAVLMLLAFVTLVLSLLKVGRFMWNPVYFRTTALLGSLFAILGETFALILFATARHRLDAMGQRATYGAALWTGLVGAITAFLGAAIGGPAYQGRFMYRADRRSAYNV